MTPPITSNRELARQLGVSETAVRKAEKAGRIARSADGSWDVVRVRASWQANTDTAQQRAPAPGLKPVPEAALGAVRDTLLAGAVLDAAHARPFDTRAELVLELLKVPAATRLRLTEGLLARLRAEAGHAAAELPAGNLWDFVAWAEQRGLRPDRPLDPELLLAALPDE